MTMIEKELTIAKVKELITDETYAWTNKGIRSAISVINSMNEVKYSTVTNPNEYADKFNDIVYGALADICAIKGIKLNSSSELLEDVRDSIIRNMDNWNMDVSIPNKEYKIGDKVKVADDGFYDATIVYDVEHSTYGLLTNDFKIKHSTSEVNSSTDYFYYLNDLGISVE